MIHSACLLLEAKVKKGYRSLLSFAMGAKAPELAQSLITHDIKQFSLPPHPPTPPTLPTPGFGDF